MLTRRWSSKAIWMRSGSSSGSICWVLLVSGRFPLSKTIISEAQEHFLTPSPRRDDHPFGGLGLRAWRRFGKCNHPAGLNFGDCFAYALAEASRELLLFKGVDFGLTDIETA